MPKTSSSRAPRGRPAKPRRLTIPAALRLVAASFDPDVATPAWYMALGCDDYNGICSRLWLLQRPVRLTQADWEKAVAVVGAAVSDRGSFGSFAYRREEFATQEDMDRARATACLYLAHLFEDGAL